MDDPWWNAVLDRTKREAMSESDLVSAYLATNTALVERGAIGELQRRNIIATRELNETMRRFEKTSWVLTGVLIVLTGVLVVVAIWH